jgi:hypothetical protein
MLALPKRLSTFGDIVNLRNSGWLHLKNSRSFELDPLPFAHIFPSAHENTFA